MSDDNSSHDPRIYFAAERTMLAWIRTGIAMMGFGFVVARFGIFLHEAAELRRADGAQVHTMGWSLWAGTTLVLLGVWVNLAATVRHARFRARFQRGESFVMPGSMLYNSLAIILALLGIAMTGYLVFLGHR